MIFFRITFFIFFSDPFYRSILSINFFVTFTQEYPKIYGKNI